MTTPAPAEALIVVDVQNDFCEGGALGVRGGSAVAGAISSIVGDYPLVIATRDFHIDPGDHFSDHPDFEHSWPPHCRAGTDGVAFAPGLDTGRVERVFAKGAYSAAYSGFEGTDEDGVGLAEWLRRHRVHSVDVVGLATDHCVAATALDAVDEGFATRVLLNFTAAVARRTATAALENMRTSGVGLDGDLLYDGAAADGE